MYELESYVDLFLLVVLEYAQRVTYPNKRRRAQQRWWVRELNLSRDEHGFYALNFVQMQERDPEEFYKITRMVPRTFNLLRSLIEPSLEKTSWREPISPSCRLFLVLLYLSQGVPKRVLAWMFRLGYTTAAEIIYETCDVLWTTLMPLYLQQPSQENWKQIAEKFQSMWNLPNCVSAIDGKHINIRCPPNAGSEYYNYKGHHSIVLLAACDANYTFTAVDIGAYGSQSDGGILSESSFGKTLLRGELNLPAPSLLPNSNINCNYYLVGDVAFPLKTFLMRPYPGRILPDDRYNFNKRLSRARRVIENAFGILVAKWRIFNTTLHMLPANTDRIVRAAVVLHNFVKLNDSAYCTPDSVDVVDNNDEIVRKGSWRNETDALAGIRNIGSNFSSRNAFQMRDVLKEYLFTNKI